MNSWTQVLFVVAITLGFTWADKVLLLEQTVLNEIFGLYDARVRPHGKNGTGPVVVEVNTYVRNLNDVDDVKMIYSAQLTFRMKWHDERLKYDDAPGLDYVTLTSPEKMWLPDLFFSNEAKAHIHKILTPNNLIRIYPSGEVLYSTRISLELFCPMTFKYYPMDQQICSIKAASYAYSTRDIEFTWKAMNPVQLSTKLYLPAFTIEDVKHSYCTSRTSTGEYSCIVVDFLFSRALTFHLLHAFVPTTWLVVLSWITFWMHPRSTATRLAIWIGLLLSIMIVTTSVADSGPRVSYIKAMDVWMGTCIVYIFLVLVEISLVHNAITKEDRLGRKSQLAMEEANSETKAMGIDDTRGNGSRPTHYTATPLKWLNKYSTQAQRIDAISRILFPASFVLFNFVYWPTYTSR